MPNVSTLNVNGTDYNISSNSGSEVDLSEYVTFSASGAHIYCYFSDADALQNIAQTYNNIKLILTGNNSELTIIVPTYPIKQYSATTVFSNAYGYYNIYPAISAILYTGYNTNYIRINGVAMIDTIDSNSINYMCYSFNYLIYNTYKIYGIQ